MICGQLHCIMMHTGTQPWHATFRNEKASVKKLVVQSLVRHKVWMRACVCMYVCVFVGEPETRRYFI